MSNNSVMKVKAFFAQASLEALHKKLRARVFHTGHSCPLHVGLGLHGPGQEIILPRCRQSLPSPARRLSAYTLDI